MSFTVDKLEKNMVKLTIEVDAEEFAKGMEAAYEKNKNKISVPGFRKGKVPKQMIEKMYGKDLFQYDAVNDLFPENYEAAVKEAGIEVVGRPDPEVVSMSEDEGATLKVKVAVKPEVELGEYTGLTVNKDVKTVDEADVDAEIKRMQDRNGRLLTREGAAENGDTVDIDFEGFVDGVPFEGGTAQGQTLKIGSGAFIPGFEEQMVGMTVGEEKDLNVTFPEKYHAENLAGKNAVFHVKVNSITKTELPELDDDFAQDNGFDTFDAYKADVAKKLQEIADTNYDVEIENALIEKAVANAQMDIPAAMIDDQLNYVMRDVEYSMMRQGLRMEDYLKYTGQTREQMAQQYRGEAENRVKIQLVLEAIRKAENIEPTAEDIDEQSAKQAKRAGQEVEAFKANLTDEHKAYLSDLAAIQKVCDLMKAGATVVDKKPEEAAETAEETKTEE